MVGWDISRKYAVFNDAQAAELRNIDTEKARIAIDSQRVVKQFTKEEFGMDGFDLPDPIAMAVLLSNNCILQMRKASVDIDLQAGHTRGMTIIDDRKFVEREKDTAIVLEVSRQYFVDCLEDALK